MSLATVGADGYPQVRVVLLKDVEEESFVFYTNRNSIKGRQLADNPRAGICFYWKSLDRQVRAVGDIAIVDDATSDAYFATRPRISQIGAWASQQSELLANRTVLEKRVADLEEEYAGHEIPRPPHWGGYRLLPQRIEFWQDRPFRLHNRDIFEREESGGWRRFLIYP